VDEECTLFLAGTAVTRVLQQRHENAVNGRVMNIGQQQPSTIAVMTFGIMHS
jgi:hypothetical protein